MPEQDAFDLTQDQAKTAVSRGWHWLIDHGRRFVTAKLLAALVGGLGFVVAAQFFLPALVAAGCLVTFLGLGGWAVQTQRLLNRERELRHWTTIDGLRVKQQEVRAQAALREATLAVADLRGGGRARMRVYPPLVQAVYYLRRKAQAAARGEVGPGQPQRQDAVPKPPDVGPVEQQLKDFREQEELIETRMQALAAPGTEWEEKAEEKAWAYHRARQAALEARKRARKGKRPTAAEPGFSFEMGRNRDGSRRVSRRNPDPTPEQIFRDENAA